MAEYIEQAIKATRLDTLDDNPSLKVIKEKTGLRPSQVALALVVFLTVILFIAQASTLRLALLTLAVLALLIVAFAPHLRKPTD